MRHLVYARQVFCISLSSFCKILVIFKSVGAVQCTVVVVSVKLALLEIAVPALFAHVSLTIGTWINASPVESRSVSAFDVTWVSSS